jgi:methylated-DNA-[protein]-cysteine S-methyltransferase
MSQVWDIFEGEVNVLKVFFYQTEIGRIGIAEDGGGITNLHFEGDAVPRDAEVSETKALKEAHRQLSKYLAGELKEFTLPLAPRGTEFQRKVWDALRRIPYGKMVSYKDIAAAVGNPKAVRAVGMANNRNPIPIFIPCHRVIGSDGKLVGYRSGLDIKQKLLDLELSGSL